MRQNELPRKPDASQGTLIGTAYKKMKETIFAEEFQAQMYLALDRYRIKLWVSCEKIAGWECGYYHNYGRFSRSGKTTYEKEEYFLQKGGKGGLKVPVKGAFSFNAETVARLLWNAGYKKEGQEVDPRVFEKIKRDEEHALKAEEKAKALAKEEEERKALAKEKEEKAKAHEKQFTDPIPGSVWELLPGCAFIYGSKIKIIKRNFMVHEILIIEGKHEGLEVSLNCSERCNGKLLLEGNFKRIE